ncbi:MAG TPA: PhaM family polyhydroxyalkanoate granule multifunctional regulatory protein [Rhodocyclaceae bacterium]|nr:PhaM family polyhydroxyalkanoate granule multifunctional regulatory protein [Rhodocyclaceae bacterium]
MTEPTANQDPMEFLKNFWANLGVPLPGMVTPTLDTDELGRRITDLKAVEGWLKNNLSMLQMTIQGLEMQRATLAALRAMSQPPAEGEPNPNPFASMVNPANPAFWPWNLAQPAEGAATDKPAAEPAPSAAKRKPKR